MTTWRKRAADLGRLQPEALDELARRVRDIESGYRAVAEQVGQLYLRADEYHLDALTARLDQPMRIASENEQTFAALLDELHQQQKRKARG